jgi:copper transport protein
VSSRGALRLVISAVAVLLALAPQAASAHALVVGSDPAAGSILSGAPARVSVFFSQGVQAFGRGLSVVGPDGRRADSGAVAASGSRLSVAVAAAGEGTYVVAWQVIAADTHPSRGSFLFSVGHTSQPALVAPAAGPLGAGLEVAARWLHFAGFALGFGAIAFTVLVLPSSRVERLAGLGVVLLLAAEPLALVAQAASFSPGAAVDPSALQDTLASPFGRLLGLRLAAALLLWALLGAGAVLRPAILAVGLGLAFVDAAGAHAQSLLPGPLALVVSAAHVAAAATWIGGLAALLWTWPVERSAVTRFGRVALVALAVAVAAGALLGISEIVSAGNLLSTGFGLVLLAKVGVVGLAILAVALRRRRLELGAMALVLAVAGLLAAVPTPAP